MLSINDLKINTKIIYNQKLYMVISATHSKLGRGGGIMRTKLRCLIDGSILEKTFAGAEKIEEAQLETKKAQYLYHNNDSYYFMETASFEQFSLSAKQLGKTADFLREGAPVDILYFNDQPINLNLPIKIAFEVTYTEPGFRGNSAANVSKSATLETDAQIQVPLFIKTGDKVVVDTRTGEYVGRE
ncbi:MAG: elongation factor P [Patescibacteria group bacterium]